MFVLGLGLRLATGMGMGMGLDMRMRLRIRMGLGIGPPAATHPHLLSPLPLALDYSCCLAIRVPVSRLIIIGWRLTIDGNFRAATTARCPVISFYSGLGVGALCSDPMRFDASSSWDSVHAAWSRGLDVIDLFNQWQAKWISLQLRLLQINANEIIQTSFGPTRPVSASIFVLRAHSQFACFENLIELQFPQIKLNFSVALSFSAVQPATRTSTKPFIFWPKLKLLSEKCN